MRDILTELISELQACFDDDCDYKFLLTMGRPPAECNTIAVFPSTSTRLRSTASSNRCRTTREEFAEILLTNVCHSIDADTDWDWAAEEKQMACVLDDVETIEACLQCHLREWLEPFVNCSDDELYVVSVVYDDMRSGGTYSVRWTIRWLRAICCPEDA